MVKSFPSESRPATSIIYDFLKERGFDSIISEYGLEPYPVRVQSIERTFIDKLFAICDYYLDGRIREHSRHLYDIHKLLPYIKIDETLKQLMVETRLARQGKAFCPSAAENQDIKELLQRVISESTYKKDYQTITEDLLFESVTYEQAIESLSSVIDSCLF
jgi:hypothetical protein